jgi:ATP-dependent DNA helicase RecG
MKNHVKIHRRNPLIADLFRRIEMVEAWGRGMTLIHQNAPAVAFREVGQLFIASFERPSYLAEGIDTTQELIGTTEKTTGKGAVLLDHLRFQPQMTITELAELLGLTADGVNYHLRKLQKDGLLLRVGGRKTGHWEVLLSAPDPAEAGRAGV